tara:strand:- start:133 stop:690 length:558 start_codon:yes stop_codon:yes gene_type:complete
MAPITIEEPDNTHSPIVFSFTFLSTGQPVAQSVVEAVDLHDGKVPAGVGVRLRPDTCGLYLPFFMVAVNLAGLMHTLTQFDPLHARALESFTTVTDRLSWLMCANRSRQIDATGLEELRTIGEVSLEVIACLEKDMSEFSPDAPPLLQQYPLTPTTIQVLFQYAEVLAETVDHVFDEHLQTWGTA